MKKLIFLFAIIISFSSCKKSTTVNTLLGSWRVDSYKENGTDKTTVYLNTYTDYLIKFDASNNYIETYKLAGVNITKAGDWKMTNGGTDYELTNQADSSKRYFHIIELNPQSASVSENNGGKEYHYLKN